MTPCTKCHTIVDVGMVVTAGFMGLGIFDAIDSTRAFSPHMGAQPRSKLASTSKVWFALAGAAAVTMVVLARKAAKDSCAGGAVQTGYDDGRTPGEILWTEMTGTGTPFATLTERQKQTWEDRAARALRDGVPLEMYSEVMAARPPGHGLISDDEDIGAHYRRLKATNPYFNPGEPAEPAVEIEMDEKRVTGWERTVFLGNDRATCSHVYPVTSGGQCMGCGETMYYTDGNGTLVKRIDRTARAPASTKKT